MYDRVILAIDSSEEATQAARTGFELARLLGARVKIVHVLDRSLLDALRSPADRDRIRAGRRELLEEIESAGVDRGVAVDSTLLEGRPAGRLIEFASAQPNPVIILGRQGRSSVSRKFLGGVTEKVLESGVAPVLVEPGTGPGVSRIPPSRILVPTDGSENAELAFDPAAELAGTTGAVVHVLSVLDLQRAGGVFNAGGLDTEFVDRLENAIRKAVESGRDRLRVRDPEIEVTTDLERSTDFDGVSGGIDSYARSRDIDLIVMGSHGRTNVKRQVLGSVTSTVLRSVEVPVLVIPRAD
ncbi:MAG: universal stress protein [Halodesulfurarchaeum sp.]|nr:universal stress protein [Halodesulfurarchaeum sp.]